LVLQAQLDGSKDEVSLLKRTYNELFDGYKELETQLAGANEKLRWRTWPDEEPEISQLIIMYEERFVYLGGGQIQSSDGDLYMCDSGDEWLPLPTSNKEKS
jgi:hypothetical protein